MIRRALVHRISANAPDDVSGIAAAIASKQIDPAGVIAVLAKTEGNGLVNDFSRGHATLTSSSRRAAARTSPASRAPMAATWPASRAFIGRSRAIP